ncbi:MAG: hypothetical protein JRF63_10640 [Deltaproteobacteria bacterium]|nr:hypothetical protein [Deltaproteobacteria bacterium]
MSRTATMEVDLVNKDHSLKPGMLARIRVQVEQRENVVVAPKSALTVTAQRKGEQSLYRAMVASGEKAVERFVSLGLEEGNQVEVIEGLAVGDQLIVKGQHLLADGDPIKPARPAAQARTPEPQSATKAEPAAPTGS